MKLRLKAFRKTNMKSLVMQDPKGGYISWDKIGDVIEVDRSFGHHLLATCPDMLEEETGSAAKSIKAPENKMVKPKDVKVKSEDSFSIEDID